MREIGWYEQIRAFQPATVWHRRNGQTVQKTDLKKELKHLYLPSAKEASIVEVPAFTFLMIDGQGDPNTAPEYAQAVEALFSVSYAVKFMVKKGIQAIDYGVMPLESLWWADDAAPFSVESKESWQWTAMIMQPSFVAGDVIDAALVEVAKKKKLPALERLRHAPFPEGRCAQILHVGPFAEEGPTVARLHRFIDEQDKKPVGKHHEIYLSDIRKAEPAKWKTVIRQPFA